MVTPIGRTSDPSAAPQPGTRTSSRKVSTRLTAALGPVGISFQHPTPLPNPATGSTRSLAKAASASARRRAAPPGGPGVAAGMAAQGHAAMHALAAVDAGDAAPHHGPTAV